MLQSSSLAIADILIKLWSCNTFVEITKIAFCQHPPHLLVLCHIYEIHKIKIKLWHTTWHMMSGIPHIYLPQIYIRRSHTPHHLEPLWGKLKGFWLVTGNYPNFFVWIVKWKRKSYSVLSVVTLRCMAWQQTNDGEWCFLGGIAEYPKFVSMVIYRFMWAVWGLLI